MATQETHPELFARKASGLVREFGFFDTFAFNVIGYAVGLVLAVTPFFAGALWPGANIFWVLVIGTAVALFNGFTYSLLSGVMPRSGGEYVYNGRVLHPAIGFMSNWGFTWSQFLGIGLYTQWTVNYGLSVSLATVGYGIDSAGLVNAGAVVGGNVPTFIIGTVIIGTVVLVQLFGMRVLRRFLNVFFVVAVIGSVVTMVVFFASTRAQFVSNFNDFMESTTGMTNAYNGVIEMAREEGFSQPNTGFLNALLALPLGYWVYIGFTYSAYIGGEVKEPQKTQTWGVIGSLLFGFVVYMLTLWPYYRVVGTEFNNAAAYLEYFAESPLPVAGVLNLFAGMLVRSPILNGLMGLSFFLWHYLLLFVQVTICVRNIFAWAFDRIVPEWLTKVTEGSRAPWSATVVVGAISWILLVLYTFTSLFDYVFNYIVIFSIAFWFTSFAAILLPYRRSGLFEAAPPSVRRRIGGVPLMTIAGVINLILFSIILYSSFTLPAFSGPVGPAAIAFVAAIYVSGIIIYYVARSIRRAQGVDLDLLYTEIPPE